MFTIAKYKTNRNKKPTLVNSGFFENSDEAIHKSYELIAVPYPDEFGYFKTRNDAIRHIVLLFNPELVDSSMEHIKRVSKEYFSGNHKLFKVVKAIDKVNY